METKEDYPAHRKTVVNKDWKTTLHLLHNQATEVE